MAKQRKRASAIVGQSDNELGSCYVATTEFIIAYCGSLCAMIQIVIRPKPSYNIPPCTAKLRFKNPPRRQACRLVIDLEAAGARHQYSPRRRATSLCNIALSPQP